MPAPLLFVNGTVLTMNHERPRAEALLVVNDTIAAVGSVSEVRSVAGPSVELVDLSGRTLLPGFNDAHCHALMYGMYLTQVDLKAPGVESIGDVQRRLAARAGSTAPGAWIQGFGYDHNKLAEQRHPTRLELDAVSPNNPAFVVHTSGHMLVANSAALAAGGVTAASPDPSGGRIVRDDAGEPNGLLQEVAQRLVEDVVPPPTMAHMRHALQLASEQLAREGVTSFQDARAGTFAPDELAAWQLASESGELKQRVSLILDVHRVYPTGRPDDTPFANGLHSGFGSERLRIGGIKIFADGSLIGRTAAVSSPYVGETDNRGFLTVVEDDYRTLVVDAHARGWQISTHAIGDRAIETVLDAYAAALQSHPKTDHRHRIEHAGLLTPELIARMAGLGVIAVTQPRFITELGDGYICAIGPERVQLCYPLASLIRGGVHTAGSSDRPVVNGAPLLGIHDAVNQRTGSGVTYAAREALSAKQALRLFTTNAAYASFEEHRKGSLTPGRLADLVVLGADPTRVSATELGSIPVAATFVGGEAIYNAEL